MLTSILIASLSLTGAPAELPLGALGRHRPPAAPYIEVWTNRDEVFHRGDKVRLYFQTDVDAYVTVFRVDTDGRVRVLFPLDPWADNYAVGGVRYQVDPRNAGYTFRVDDYPGQGYLFAVATIDPFVYDAFVRGDHWDYRVIGAGGRIAGDPYVAIGDLIADIVPEHYPDYNYDVVPYFVDRRYEYPRFLCYDCHAYAPYTYWDPYAHSCFKFRIVIYDDPYYYPARVTYGTRVVYRRPRVLVPRYVFRDRSPTDRDMVIVRERPVDADGRRRVDPGVTRRTLPGGVQVPTPRRESPGVAGPESRRAMPTPDLSAPDRKGISPATPTLERRDPARGQSGGAKVEPRRASDGKVKTPKPAAPRRAQPAAPPARRADPPKGRTEAKRGEAPPRKKNDPPKRRN